MRSTAATRLRQDQQVTVAGLVLVRQMPGTAKGVVFMTLEDETDIANIIVWPKVFAKNRRTVMTARFLAVRGRLQRAGLVIHVVAQSFVDLSAELHRLRDGDLFAEGATSVPSPQADLSLLKSRDFHWSISGKVGTGFRRKCDQLKRHYPCAAAPSFPKMFPK